MILMLRATLSLPAIPFHHHSQLLIPAAELIFRELRPGPVLIFRAKAEMWVL
jgi:hypothetical protein